MKQPTPEEKYSEFILSDRYLEWMKRLPNPNLDAEIKAEQAQLHAEWVKWKNQEPPAQGIRMVAP